MLLQGIHFFPCFAEAWYKAIHLESLVVGFVKAGVCPFNPEAIKIPLIPPDVRADEGGASGDNSSDPENEIQGDDLMVTNSDPFMDWQGNDKSGVSSLLKKSYFTPK